MLSLIPSEVIAFLSYDNPCSMNENIDRPDNLYINSRVFEEYH